MKKLVIGVTGSIASGKSVISNYIKKQINSTLLDVDVIQKSLNNYDEDIKAKVFELWPETKKQMFLVEDEEYYIDKDIFKSVVFNNYQKLKQLEAICIPKVEEQILLNINDFYNSDKNICFIVNPLMFYMDTYHYCDAILNLTAPYEVYINRLMIRNNISKDSAIYRHTLQTDKNKVQDNYKNPLFDCPNGVTVEATCLNFLKIFTALRRKLQSKENI